MDMDMDLRRTLSVGKRLAKVQRSGRLVLFCLLPVMLAGCNPKAEPGKYQVMAKVNGKEITVPEVNQYIDQMKSYRGSKTQIRRNAVNAVIDQHLLIDAAKNEGLDKNPVVMQMLLLSQKQALIKEYLDEQYKSLPMPGPAEISAYYQSHPLLFANRTLYVVNYYNIDTGMERQQKLLSQLQASKNSSEFFNTLSQTNIIYDQWQTVKTPEDMSDIELSALSKMSIDGALVVSQTRKAMELLVLVSKIQAPIPLNRARLKIASILNVEEEYRTKEAIIQKLREHAQIQYLDQ